MANRDEGRSSRLVSRLCFLTMEKKCLVIMPLGDPDGYAEGHLNRVYDYIIVSACKSAGFMPIKADDIPTTGDMSLDIIKNILESDMVICDLSSKNSNVLYGFAIRQVLNLPVTVIKDMKTKNVFDIQEFGGVEYDESLRIDTVQKAIQNLGEALKNIFSNKGEINSLLTRLAITPAQLNETKSISYDAELATLAHGDQAIDQTENAEQEEIHLPIISPLPDYVGDPIAKQDIDKLKPGDFLFHMNHGKGEIKTIKKISKDKIADIQFESGSKILVLGTSGFFRKINE